MGFLIIIVIIFGVIGAMIASSKKRSALIWFILCACFPLISLIILLFMPTAKNEELEQVKKQLSSQRDQLNQVQNTALLTDTIECPKCAETIKAKASVCRFCNYELIID